MNPTALSQEILKEARTNDFENLLLLQEERDQGQKAEHRELLKQHAGDRLEDAFRVLDDLLSSCPNRSRTPPTRTTDQIRSGKVQALLSHNTQRNNIIKALSVPSPPSNTSRKSACGQPIQAHKPK